MPKARPGTVSVVLVNFRGVDDTLEAIAHLKEVDWPVDQLQIIVVENGSGDDSLARLRAGATGIEIVVSAENRGFAGGCNFGVAASSGEFVAFLNSDARPDPQWIRAAVDAFAESEEIGAVASRVLDWEGATVDYVDAALTWFGMGYKPDVGLAVRAGAADEARNVLFGTGSAMFVRRTVYEELGGFDERFFMFFEDVDLGWRLNLLGYRYRYQPTSIAFHKHHGTVNKFGEFKETYYLERNALFTLYKNLGAENLDRLLPAAMALSVRRSVAKGGLDSARYDFRVADGDAASTESVAKSMLAGFNGIDQFVEQLPELTVDRDVIQANRVVSDRSIWPLFRETDAPSLNKKSYLEGYENLVHAFDVLREPRGTRVLVITGDPIGARMAGPAIRAWNISETLAAEHDVLLLTTSRLENVEAPFAVERIRAGDNKSFFRYEEWADVIVFQGDSMFNFEALKFTHKIVVADIYDPMHLEQLEQARELPSADWDRHVAHATDVMNEQLAKADFFLCASERQRHFYLGQLVTLGRISPTTYEKDENLTGLIAVAPFGLSETPPVTTAPVLRGVVPGISSGDKVLLWGGGLYNWFDPASLIRAVAKISQEHDNVRLFFQGTKHPHPGVPEMAIVSKSRTLAAELGVLGKHVFFNDSWVEYADRQNYLLEADLGVSTHFDHIETTFSFRTRILDYLWAGLPMVVTEGDAFAELVRDEGLGIVVPAADVDALAEALDRMLFDEKLIASSRANVQRVRERFTWASTLEPLVDFMRAPHRAPDAAGGRSIAPLEWHSAKRPPKRSKQYGFRHDVGRALHYLRRAGPLVVARKVLYRIRNLR